MIEYFSGCQIDPSEQIQQAFQKISENEMKGMPFLHPDVEVGAYAFQLFEGQWIGAVLTPWMLSVFILPGPNQEWPLRTVGEKIGVSLPQKNLPFIVSQVEGVGQYLACSLMSPLDRKKSANHLIEIAKACIDELLLEVEQDEDSKINKDRRKFFMRKID